MVGIACSAASATICSRRLKKNGSLPTRSAPTRFCTIAVNAASIPPGVVAVRTTSCSPMARAASCSSAGCRADSGLFGLERKATIVALGTSSCSSPSRLGPSSAANQLTPVTLPPGRLRLATRPRLTGSSLLVKTIGIVLVAAMATSAELLPPVCRDHTYLRRNKTSRERRQPIQSSLRPAIFDRDVLTLDVTDLVQATPERGCHGSERLRRLSIQESNRRHRRLLRPCRKRPCRRAAERG